MRKRLLFTLFAILFCSTTFGQKPNWEAPNSGAFQGNMTVSAYFKIYGEEQFNQNIEFAAFCGNELRGVGSKPVEVTLDGEKHYLSVMTVHGNANDIIKFKIWDPVLEEVLGTLEEKNFYLNDVVGPIAMDFYQEYWDFTRDVNEIPQSMTIISQIAIDDNVVIRPNLEVAAFHGDELRGIGRYDEIDNNMIYFTIYGNKEETENITFKLYDHNDGTLITESDYSKPFKADDVLGDYFNPEIINFITASYVAQIGENKYTTFEKAYEAAQDNDNIILLDDITLESTPTVISKDINITLGEYAITGTVELANTGATITGAENGVTEVITNVADYKVVYDGSMYKLVAKVYVAKVGDVQYETIQEAVSEASVDATIVIIGNASNETVTVDKNLTITGSNFTLNNVAFNADGADELTVSGLSFTGNSWINSGTAEKLTVSGVTADVTPSNTAYTNSRSAFISLGRSEQQQLELYVTNCNIVANGGADPILGWAAITEADIIDNTFGSESAYQTDSDCVKFMAIAQGAVFNITGNTIYSNYNGIVFGQNTTRDNAYTVNVNTNNFYGSADHIWIEVSGSNTTHATIKATSDNKVNGNEFTANDIKLHPNLNTFTSYAGVDVVLDVNGKVLGGTFKYVADGVIADGYKSSENADGTYSIVKKLSGEIAYRAYVTDTESVEAVSVELENVYASSSLKVELYNVKDGVEELLVTTTYAKTDFPIDADSFTCFMVLSGTPNEYWSTTINAEELTIENLPTTIKLYVDGELVDTFNNALGAGTNEDETAEYKALDCVYDYEVAKVGDKVYWNIDKAIANWTAGSTLTLLADVTLSDVITLKSTEHHILNLDTYTMTAAEGKNAIEITPEGAGTAAKQCLTINADSENPGGITATSKSCIYYKKTNGINDRLMVTINGGVFNGSYSINSSSNNGGQACPYYLINGGTFNGNVSLTKAMLKTTGGIFNGWVNCTGDSTAHRLIAGGTFKTWQFMTADAPNKFAVGTNKQTYDLGVYIDDNGYLVVGGPVITEAGTTFEASAGYDSWKTDNYFNNFFYYLQYSSAATNGLYYTSAEEALADNNKTNGSVNIYTDELDLRSLNYKGTLVIEDDLTVTFNEGITPVWSVVAKEDGKIVVYTDDIENGIVKRTYSVIVPVAKIGDDKFFASLEAALEAAQANETITMLADVTLSETLTIEKAITLNLNENTVTGADGAIVFNVKAATTIKNGTVLGNKSGASSGLIDIYADINLDGVTIETTKIRALAFKESVSGTPSTATLTNCNVTGGFKGYGGSVWEIKSGVYKASSTSITDQLNGTASVSGGTFHYEIDETDCAPGYVVKNNGDGTWTVEYAPAAFVDTDKDGVYDEDVDVLYGNLDQIFADYRTGDVHVVLTKEVVVANNKVDTDVDAHFYITTNVEGGTTMDFLYADPEDVQPYNCVQNMDIAENVTLNVKYFTIYGNFNLKGTVNAFYPFIIAANVNIAEDALFNQNVEGVNSEAIQIKDGAVVTVEGKVEAKYINLYKSDSYTGEQGACLRVTGANAEVNVSSVDLWKGETLLIVENGAKFKANSIKASRGGSIEVDGATIDAAIRLGHDTTDETTLTASGTCTLGQITLATLGSKVVGPEGFEVVSGVNGYGVNYYDEVYSLVQIVTQSHTLYAGWNWFSSYVDINGEAGWENLKTGLGSNAMLVKNQNSMSQYYNTDNIVGWDGTLEETSVKEMYMIRMSADHDLTLTGKLVDPSENPITLHHNGWTWIGYPMNQDLALEDVLKGFNPNAGDRIKSHQGFSQYYDNELYEGWWGTLETMTPGYGYMYYNADENNATLKYSYPADGSKSEVRANITSENNYWVPASSRYASNMNIVAMLEADGDNYEIAAFVGGEVRGSARPIYVEPLDAYMFFLTVHGEDVEEMTFKVYDLATGEEYNLNDRMNYTDNAIVGSITEPYIFRGTVGVGETSLSEVNVYPNPTTIGNEINLGTECDTVEVFNALGVKVAEYQNVDTVDALETAGVYVIRITNNGNVQNCRLIVK